MKRRTCKLGALATAVAALCVFGSNAAPQARDSAASRADSLAAAIYFEGIPFEEASDLSGAEVARLVELLRDPDQIRQRQRANILVALGMSGSPAAYDAIADYAQRGPSGELERLEFRAQRSIAYAMGHLARVDGRALAWLVRAATDANAQPQRSFRQLDSRRVAQLMREGAITGLALSGRPDAARVLTEIGAAPGADPRVVERAKEALLLHARMAREGPASALRNEFGPDR